MKKLLFKIKLFFLTRFSRKKNALVVYKYQLPAVIPKALIVRETIGDRIIVPIAGDSRSLPSFITAVALEGMEKSGKFDASFLNEKRIEWKRKLWGDNPKTIEVIKDIYNYVVFSKKMEGMDYIEYRKKQAELKFE